MAQYFRPLVQTDRTRPKDAFDIAGGWCWFDQVEVLQRGETAAVVPAVEIPEATRSNICRARRPVAGVSMDHPRLMGILNATPDSFSDGGEFHTANAGIAQGERLIKEGADFLDIGGESTRPGAKLVPVKDEIARVEPIIQGLAGHGFPISIDTRKSGVADAAMRAGARIINDVSALRFDPQLAEIAAKSGIPICLMHSPSDPDIMQKNPHYDNVLLDVFDHLSERIDHAIAAGISRHNIIVDPGIGFGKTDAHNLALLRGLGLFHGLGCPILLGVSRKSLIGRIGDVSDPMARLPGSVSLAIAGFSQGVQITRVHDMAETKQALRLWVAATGTGQDQ